MEAFVRSRLFKIALGYLILFVGNCIPIANAQLVAHLTFDESSGSVAADSTGSFPGTLSGGAAFVSGGISGNAVSLTESSTSFVTLGTSFPGFTSGDFSIVIWVNTTDTVASFLGTVIAGKQNGGSLNGYLLFLNAGGFSSEYGATGKVSFYDTAPPGQEVVSTATVTDGRWHQIVGVHKAGGNKQIYVDGAPAEASNSSVTVTGNSVPFLIGATTFNSSPVATYDGLIDDLQAYSRALTSAQVKFLFSNPGLVVGESPSNPVLSPTTQIADPPLVSVNGAKVTLTLQKFRKISLTASAVLNPMAIGVKIDAARRKKKKPEIQYTATIKDSATLSQTIARRTSKRNEITFRDLSAASYSVSYNARVRRGRKVLFTTNESPATTFTVE